MFVSESFVYLCDFHREQSWDRWLKASHNCIGNDKPEILNLFRSIAHANIIEEFNMAKTTLEVIKLMHAFNIFNVYRRKVYHDMNFMNCQMISACDNHCDVLKMFTEN